MKDDYISREEALNVVHKYFEHYLQLNDDICLDGLRSLPSVGQKEKTGKWIDDANKIDAQFGRHTYICSECGKYAEYFISGTEVWWDRIKPNFCPNCGAKMEVSE